MPTVNIAISSTKRPLSFISLSHSDNQSELITKFYNSSKVAVGGNMLTLHAYCDLTSLDQFEYPET